MLRVLLTACFIAAVSVTAARASGHQLSDEQHQFFDNLLGIIKAILCKADLKDDGSDDVFQMILNLAKIFLCDGPDQKQDN